ncbi:MAG TPA: methylmalonyl Co-A mutase-associated GTPase MeaB [Bacteroidia bacterium]|nr:methylmalonyl Co-A mutase-associated GTPase MeaB [Bacteroidia bacterium]
MTDVKDLVSRLLSGDFRALSRAITVVENDLEGTDEILSALPAGSDVPLVGITGPPGAGKSTLINAIIHAYVSEGKKIAVIAVDPTSPFNFGSILGDRLRMSDHFNNENVFIRSLATRGSLGGLSAKAIEVSDLVRAAGFDLVIVETVGVGQSEVEIAGLADTTVLVLVPESGDEVQVIKSGVMEIADVFAVNKADRPGANIFISNLHHLVHARAETGWKPVIVRTVASRGEGIAELISAIKEHEKSADNPVKRKAVLLAQRAWKLMQEKSMKHIDREKMVREIEERLSSGDFHLFRFVQEKSAGTE